MSRSFDALRNAALRETGSVDQAPNLPTQMEVAAACAKEVRHITACPGPESHITLDADGKPNTVRERFRYMEHQLRSLRRTVGIKRILVTSSVPREGKTVVACNLAATLACGGERVLLIDADLRGPGSSQLFGQSLVFASFRPRGFLPGARRDLFERPGQRFGGSGIVQDL
jgi:Mrp family chromosome partitioning ATPase